MGTLKLELGSGGVIENNEADYGGGILATFHGELTITGGSIQKNTARKKGGGVYIGNPSTTKDVPLIFNMTGGTIFGENNADKTNTVGSGGRGKAVYIRRNASGSNSTDSNPYVRDTTITSVYYSGTFSNAFGTISNVNP